MNLDKLSPSLKLNSIAELKCATVLFASVGFRPSALRVSLNSAG